MPRRFLGLILALAGLLVLGPRLLATPSGTGWAVLEEEFFRHGWNVGEHPRLVEGEEAAAWRRRVQGVDPHDLTATDSLRRDLLLWRLDAAAASAELRHAVETDPFVYVPHAEHVDLLVAEATGGGNEVARWLVPALDRIADTLRAGAARLKSVPKDDVEGVLKACDEVSQRLRSGIEPLLKGDPHAAAAIAGARNRATVALLDFRARVADALPRRAAREAAAARRDVAAFRLRWDFGLDLTPESLLEIGWRTYRDTLDEMDRVGRRIDPARSWRAIVEDMKGEHPEPDALLATADREMKRACDFVRKHDLVTVPAFALHVATRWGDPQADTPFGFYAPPCWDDPDLQGYYTVIPLDEKLSPTERTERLRGNNIFWTRVVSLHEAIPGHHLQFAIALKNGSRVERLFYNTSFIEGWGLYCEEMMYRSGYNADPKTRLSQLKMRLWRAARVIIDLGSQLGILNKDEGTELLVKGVGMEPSSSRQEIGRYLAAPGYYSGYLAGYLEIEHLRTETTGRAQGGNPLREFHDRLLSGGPIPFAVVRRNLVR